LYNARFHARKGAVTLMERSNSVSPENTGSAERNEPSAGVNAAPPVIDPNTGRVVSGPALRNAMSLVTVAWIFGNVWYVTVTGAPFALFTLAMKPSPFEIGLLSAIPYMAALLSIPASLLIERTGARKRIFFFGLYLQRGLWLLLGLVPLWIVSRYGVAAAPMALWFFIPAYFIMHAGNAVGGPAWVSWMADVVPHRTRGKYFARRRMWALLLAIPAAWFVGWLLDEYARDKGDTIVTMRWCAMIFVAASVFGLLDIAAFHRVPEVPQAPRTGAGLVKAMAGPLKDKQYLWFAGYVAILMFAVVPIQQQFYQFYLIDKVGLKNKSVQVMMLVLPALVQLLLIPVWGRAADRMGKRPLLIMATLGLVPIGLGWCFVDKETAWLGYLLSALGIALWSGVDLVNFNFVIEMSSSRGRKDGQPRIGGTAYHAVNSVILNIAALTGGLAWGAIAQWLKDWHWTVPGWKTLGSYDVLFIVSGVLRLAAVVIFLPRIIEPAARPTFEAMRFMGANIYNNVTNVILGPLRLMRSRRGKRARRGM